MHDAAVTTSNADSANHIWVVKWSDRVTANGLAADLEPSDMLRRLLA